MNIYVWLTVINNLANVKNVISNFENVKNVINNLVNVNFLNK